MPFSAAHRNKNQWWRLFKISALLYLCMLFLLLLIAIVIWLSYRSDLPSLSQLESYEPSLITRIYSDDGKVLKEFYQERRILVPLEKMPSTLRDALISKEDRKFYKHWGVDLHRLIGALYANLKALRYAQGASTITQQLARMLFLTREKILTRKIKEWMTAIQIERKYSKDQILEMYLNHYYFGQGAYGVQAAAQTFFSKNVEDLTLGESALLIGLLGSPYRYDPLEHPEVAMQRRNIVLGAMEDFGTVSSEEAQHAMSEPLHLNPHAYQSGLAPYFVEHVRQYLEAKYGSQILYQGGISVFTTLDTRLQAIAEQATEKKAEELQATVDAKASQGDSLYIVLSTTASGEDTLASRQIQTALVAMDPKTGYIKALVGGRDFRTNKFNLATQAPRQPGSAFKPFLYAAAIDNGFKTTDIIYDAPIVLPAMHGQEEWRPRNYDRIFRGPVTLREALRRSINLVAIKLLQRISPSQVIFYAQRMGIKTHLCALPGHRHRGSEAAGDHSRLRRLCQWRHSPRAHLDLSDSGPGRKYHRGKPTLRGGGPQCSHSLRGHQHAPERHGRSWGDGPHSSLKQFHPPGRGKNGNDGRIHRCLVHRLYAPDGYRRLDWIRRGDDPHWR